MERRKKDNDALGAFVAKAFSAVQANHDLLPAIGFHLLEGVVVDESEENALERNCASIEDCSDSTLQIRVPPFHDKVMSILQSKSNSVDHLVMYACVSAHGGVSKVSKVATFPS